MTALLALGLIAAGLLALAVSELRSRRRPPLLVPATLLDCGCLRIGGGLLLPCAAHDPHAEPPVGQWAQEMEDK